MNIITTKDDNLTRMGKSNTRKLWSSDSQTLALKAQECSFIVPRRTSGLTVHKKIWRWSEAYRNFRKRYDWTKEYLYDNHLNNIYYIFIK